MAESKMSCGGFDAGKMLFYSLDATNLIQIFDPW